MQTQEFDEVSLRAAASAKRRQKVAKARERQSRLIDCDENGELLAAISDLKKMPKSTSRNLPNSVRVDACVVLVHSKDVDDFVDESGSYSLSLAIESARRYEFTDEIILTKYQDLDRFVIFRLESGDQSIQFRERSVTRIEQYYALVSERGFVEATGRCAYPNDNPIGKKPGVIDR